MLKRFLFSIVVAGLGLACTTSVGEETGTHESALTPAVTLSWSDDSGHAVVNDRCYGRVIGKTWVLTSADCGLGAIDAPIPSPPGTVTVRGKFGAPAIRAAAILRHPTEPVVLIRTESDVSTRTPNLVLRDPRDVPVADCFALPRSRPGVLFAPVTFAPDPSRPNRLLVVQTGKTATIDPTDIGLACITHTPDDAEPYAIQACNPSGQCEIVAGRAIYDWVLRTLLCGQWECGAAENPWVPGSTIGCGTCTAPATCNTSHVCEVRCPRSTVYCNGACVPPSQCDYWQ